MIDLLRKTAPELSKVNLIQDYFKKMKDKKMLTVDLFLKLAQLERKVKQTPIDEKFWEEYKEEKNLSDKYDDGYKLLHWVAPSLSRSEIILQDYLRMAHVEKRPCFESLRKLAKLEELI